MGRNGARWVAGLLVALTAAGCSPMDDVIVAIFGRSMRDQPSVSPYEDPRLPPEGSVPFASGNYPASPDEVALGQPAGVEMPPPVTPIELLREDPVVRDLVNPVEPTPASLDRGEELYLRTCLPCHGETGQGDGPVTRHGVPPFSIVGDEARARSDGYLYTIIRIGRGAMPQYGHQVTHFDRWHLVNYVRELQGLGPDEDR